jgi:hypothetical protein
MGGESVVEGLVSESSQNGVKHFIESFADVFGQEPQHEVTMLLQ